MGWLSRKPDPLSSRARALNSEIADLEAKIKRLDAEIQRQQSQPAPRPASIAPSVSAAEVKPSPPLRQAGPAVHEPIFEEVDIKRLDAESETSASAARFNELGVRKYDLPALLARIRNHFRGPSTTNPKLVNYLAAGGIQGLRPLRYEKRVARNRFIALVAVLFVVLLGLILAFVRHSR
jgi:hypothetical protein